MAINGITLVVRARVADRVKMAGQEKELRGNRVSERVSEEKMKAKRETRKDIRGSMAIMNAFQSLKR